MGKKLILQKQRFCGLEGGPKSPDNVLHVIDLRNIPDYQNRCEVVRSTLKAAEQHCSPDTIKNTYFLGLD